MRSSINAVSNPMNLYCTSKIMKYTIVLGLLAVVGYAKAGNVTTSCVAGQPPSYSNVNILIDGVECTALPCSLPHGSTANAVVTFTTDRPVTTIKQRVNATVDTIVTPFPLPNADKGCENLDEDTYCPLDPGDTPTITVSMPILSIYPKVNLLLKFFFLDQNDEQLSCFLLDAKVTD